VQRSGLSKASKRQLGRLKDSQEKAKNKKINVQSEQKPEIVWKMLTPKGFRRSRTRYAGLPCATQKRDLAIPFKPGCGSLP